MLAVLVIAIPIAACGDKPEHAKAKQLMSEFTCSPEGSKDTNGRWGALMANDREKAQTFISKYEQGKHMFNIPIDQVVENQLKQFKIACDSSKKAPLGL